VAVIGITGSTGFIGLHLASFIADRAHRPVPITRADVETRLESRLAGVECLVHLAGRAHVLSESDPNPAAAFATSNLVLTQRVMSAAIFAGVRRFVFVSSAGVLGNESPPNGFSDSSIPRPYDDYSKSKLDAEIWMRNEINAPIERVVIRPPLVYGPGAGGNFARLVRAASSGWPLPVGAITAQRSMVGVRNLCEFILLNCLDDRAVNQTMLVSDIETVDICSLTGSLQRLFGRRRRIVSIPLAALIPLLKLAGRERDVPRLTQPFVLRAERASQLLGWRPPFSLVEELEWTVAALRSQARDPR
jgi:nucleoside-diphosphate-sugar epimerase